MDNKSYTKKDFTSCYNELLELIPTLTDKWDTTNEFDPGMVLTKLDAVIVDKLCYLMDKTNLELFPNSVTQRDNAVQLYDSLNYRMSWYKSAVGTVTFYITQNAIDSDGNYKKIVIEPFMNLSNDDGSLNYVVLPASLVSSLNVYNQGNTITCQTGTSEDYTFAVIQGKMYEQKNLSVYDIEDNTVYLDHLNVAENGIFVSSISSSYNNFTKVNNVDLYSSSDYVYELHIDEANNSSYIVFGSCLDNITSEITIKYIVSDGESGNASAKTVTQIVDSITFTNDDSTDASDYIAVRNTSKISGGSDPESISDAYYNYKLTIPTTNTLITSTDFYKAIRQMVDSLNIPILSNCIVLDNVDDINRGSYVYTLEEDVSKYEYTSFLESDSPYDLTVRILPYEANDYYTNFVPSITYGGTNILTSIKNKIKDNKMVNLNLVSPNEGDLYLIVALFKLDCSIITKDKITKAEASNLEQIVKETIQNYYTSSKINFGEEINYTDFISTVQNCDDRINVIGLKPFEYKYRVYKMESNVPILKPIGDDKILYSKINSIDTNILGNLILSGKSNYYTFKNIEFSPENTKTIHTVSNILTEDTLPTGNSVKLDSSESVALVTSLFEKTTDYGANITIKGLDAIETIEAGKCYPLTDESYSNNILTVTPAEEDSSYELCLISTYAMQKTDVKDSSTGDTIKAFKTDTNDTVSIYKLSKQTLPGGGQYVLKSYGNLYKNLNGEHTITIIDGETQHTWEGELNSNNNVLGDYRCVIDENGTVLTLYKDAKYILKPGETLLYKVGTETIAFGEGTVIYNNNNKELTLTITSINTAVTSTTYNTLSATTSLEIINTSITSIPGGTTITGTDLSGCSTTSPKYTNITTDTTDNDNKTTTTSSIAIGNTKYIKSEYGKPYLVIPFYNLSYINGTITIPDNVIITINDKEQISGKAYLQFSEQLIVEGGLKQTFTDSIYIAEMVSSDNSTTTNLDAILTSTTTEITRESTNSHLNKDFKYLFKFTVTTNLQTTDKITLTININGVENDISLSKSETKIYFEAIDYTADTGLLTITYSLNTIDTDESVSIKCNNIVKLIEETITDNSNSIKNYLTKQNYNFFYEIDETDYVDVEDIFNLDHPYNKYVICQMSPTAEDIKNGVTNNTDDDFVSDISVISYCIEG